MTTETVSGVPLAQAVELLQYALMAALAAAAYFWWWTAECRCEKCGYHVNEARVRRAALAEAAHDRAHKGPGHRPGDPDLYSCRDEACDRNPRGEA